MRHLLLVTALAACSKSEPPPPPPAPPPEPPPKAVKIDPTGDLGTCSLEATGAFTAQETIPGRPGTKHWSSDEQAGLRINCTGKDIRLSIVTKPDATVPFGPKTYVVTARGGDLVLLGRAGKPLADLAGAIDVTAFDGTHLAGTIALTAKQTGGGSVKLGGSFDYKRR